MEEEPERFSHDLEWMPKLVLMAKNVYVWLHQLSRKYRRSIYSTKFLMRNSIS
jgi:hypothetical protein